MSENPYHRMTVAEKHARNIDRMREPAVACPSCDTQTTASDLIAHAARCPGPRDPHPASKWVTWSEAKALGVAEWTLSRWVTAGDVRHQGGRMNRRYLLRDIAMRLANRRRRR